MNHICCIWRYRDLTEKTGRVTNHQTTSSPWNRFAFNFGMRRCQIPSISPPPPRNGVSLGKGSGDFGDKSRTTPFKSCEAYVKCTRDNRLCRGTCLTFLSGIRCFCETRERSPRMFTWTRFCQKASSPRSLSAAATLVAISRAQRSLLFIHTVVLLSVCTAESTMNGIGRVRQKQIHRVCQSLHSKNQNAVKKRLAVII